MKKLLKKISLILLTVCAVFGCAFAVTACAGGNANEYVFIIKNTDGTAYNNTSANTQICTEGESSGCYLLTLHNIYPDANGKITLSQEKINEICRSETNVTNFAFHVLGADGYNEDCSFEINGVGEYTCTLYI